MHIKSSEFDQLTGSIGDFIAHDNVAISRPVCICYNYVGSAAVKQAPTSLTLNINEPLLHRCHSCGFVTNGGASNCNEVPTIFFFASISFSVAPKLQSKKISLAVARSTVFSFEIKVIFLPVENHCHNIHRHLRLVVNQSP